MIDSIIDNLNDIFKNNEKLADVMNYHKVNGMIPDIGTSISVGCEEIDYEDYDNETDEVTAELHIFVYSQEADPEYGESKIQTLAQSIRKILLKDPTLSGLISNSIVKKINFLYADSSDSLIWHAAMITFYVLYYESKSFEDDDSGIVEDVDIEIEGM